MSAIDIAATLVSLGGGDASGPPLDGVDLTPYVSGAIKSPPHEALFWRTRGAGSWSVRTPDAKYVRDPATGTPRVPQLFDMRADPYESTDVRDERPEVRRQLASLWNDWNAQNEPNKYLHAPDYQQARLEFYQDLRRRLDAEAANHQPAVID